LIKTHSPFFNDEELSAYYNQRIVDYGANLDALQWNSKHSQDKRYEVIYSLIDPTCKQLLDLGCGLGDFYLYAKQKHATFQYIGIDISEKMICHAQRAYPSGTFRCANLQWLSPRIKVDTIVASGLINLRMAQHEAYVKHTLEAMLKRASKQVIINMLATNSKRHKHSKAFVYNNEALIREYLSDKPYTVKRYDGYLNNDVSLLITK